MSDLISREALRQSIEAMKARYGNENSSLIEQGEVLDLIAESPTVDTVEVVRCKDCKYFYTPEHFSNMGACMHTHWLPLDSLTRPLVAEEHFCSYGERKEVIE